MGTSSTTRAHYSFRRKGVIFSQDNVEPGQVTQSEHWLVALSAVKPLVTQEIYRPWRNQRMRPIQGRQRSFETDRSRHGWGLWRPNRDLGDRTPSIQPG